MNICDKMRDQYHNLNALNATQAKALNEHLASCQQCRDYIEQLSTNDKLLQNVKKKAACSIEKHAIVALAQHQKRQKLWRMFIAAFGAITSLGAMFWFNSQQSLTIIGSVILAMWATFSVLYLVILFRQGNARTHGINTNSSLFEGWQKDLQFKVRIIRFFAPVVFVEFVSLIAIILFKGALLGNGLAIVFGISITMAIYCLHQYCFTLPRLSKELKMLVQEQCDV